MNKPMKSTLDSTDRKSPSIKNGELIAIAKKYAANRKLIFVYHKEKPLKVDIASG